MSVCVRGELKRWGECFMWERENQGVFSQQALHAFLPCMCVCGWPMKRVGVCIFCMEEEFIHACAPTWVSLCLYMRVTVLCVCFCVCHALTNWRNTCPSACWGWGSGCRLVSTADNTSLCNSRMSSIFENRIYKQRGDVKGLRPRGRKR